MSRGAFRSIEGETFGGDEWRIVETLGGGRAAAHGESVFTIGNGFVGVRGVFEEDGARDATYLNAVYEHTPIRYHEAAHGFASESDTRLPVADATHIDILVDGERFAMDAGETASATRTLDLKTGVLTRTVLWRSPKGREVRLTFERATAVTRPGLYAIRVTVVPESGCVVAFHSHLHPPHTENANPDAPYDPRTGPGIERSPWEAEKSFASNGVRGRVDRLPRSGFRVAAAMRHDLSGDEAVEEGERLNAHAGPDAPARLVKYIAYAADRDAPAAELEKDVSAALDAAFTDGFEMLAAEQARALARFRASAGVDLPRAPALQRALRFNLFQLFQAVGRGGARSIAAKGQTGEGYEGHVFWDAEIFALPVFAHSDPALARGMLEYRYKGLDHAREIARRMGHAHGALYPWRTIGGGECSAFFPAGTAQYHINADISHAIGVYMAATDDRDFLIRHGAEMLIETARIWLDVGHYNADRGGAFCIDKVTGPDEYSALVDNNYYTNAMAKAHLRRAADAADKMRTTAPDAWAGLAARLSLADTEIPAWRKAAAAMRLPVDDARGIIAQDDAFLSKAKWDFAATPPEKFPLLLHYHPLTIYRYQVCKQADAVLALFLAGEGLDPALKRRTFDYYDAVTTHDSTLSPSTFAIVAAEVGALGRAAEYFRMTALVDLENLCGNSDHGLHMAALAGSWQALVYGFAGFRAVDGMPSFRPVVAPAIGAYAFRIRFRGRLLSVSVSDEGVEYALSEGESLPLLHDGERLLLEAGAVLHAPLADMHAGKAAAQ